MYCRAVRGLLREGGNTARQPGPFPWLITPCELNIRRNGHIANTLDDLAAERRATKQRQDGFSNRIVMHRGLLPVP